MAVVLDIDERKRAEEALAKSQQELASELSAMSRLHALSSRLLSANNITSALEDVLENAIETCGADFGTIQLYNPQTEALEMFVQRGFGKEFLDYFQMVRVDDGSASAQAMKTGERIVIEDVNQNPEYTPHCQIAADAGYRAIQSTPLKTHDAKIVGMLSTHFRMPRRISERDESLLDLYAHHAADFIVRLRFEEALKEADRRKDEFLATLAHELRNPLAPISNAVQMLKEIGSSDPRFSRKPRVDRAPSPTHGSITRRSARRKPYYEQQIRATKDSPDVGIGYKRCNRNQPLATWRSRSPTECQLAN